MAPDRELVIKHTFLQISGAGAGASREGASDLRRRGRSSSDFAVEYDESPKGRTEAEKFGRSDDEACSDDSTAAPESSTLGRASLSSDGRCSLGFMPVSEALRASRQEEALRASQQEEDVIAWGLGERPAPTTLPLPAMVPMPMPQAVPMATSPMMMLPMQMNGQQVLVPMPMMGGGWPQQLGAFPQQGLAALASQSPALLQAHAAALCARAAEAEASARRATAALRQVKENQRAMATPTPLVEPHQEPKASDQRTTLMFRNLPLSYTRSPVVKMLDSLGMSGHYCFIYVPTDFKSLSSFGYAFIGFCNHDAAVRAKKLFHGFTNWDIPWEKSCDVAWSGPVQGLQQHTDRYRNSPVMHPSVPDEYKPAVFVAGKRVTFPAPTKRIRPPRLRHGILGDVLQSA